MGLSAVTSTRPDPQAHTGKPSRRNGLSWGWWVSRMVELSVGRSAGIVRWFVFVAAADPPPQMANKNND